MHIVYTKKKCCDIDYYKNYRTKMQTWRFFDISPFQRLQNVQCQSHLCQKCWVELKCREALEASSVRLVHTDKNWKNSYFAERNQKPRRLLYIPKNAGFFTKNGLFYHKRTVLPKKWTILPQNVYRLTKNVDCSTKKSPILPFQG